MVLVNRETIEAQQPIIMKWADSPFNVATDLPDSQYAFNPGWAQPTQVDNFYKRLEEKTSIIKDATFIKMESLQHNIEYLRNDLKFDDVRYLDTDGNDAAGNPLVGRQIQDIYQFDESVPSFRRNSLNAKNLVAYTLLPETFLKENIEKESFLPFIEQDLGMRAGLEAERIGMFGIADTTRPHGRSAMDSIDGIFKQLKDISSTAAAGTDAPQGFGSPIVTSKSIITQLQNGLFEYVNQNGRKEYSKLYVSAQLYGLILQEAAKRETTKGDSVFFDGTEVRILGTPIERVDFLNPMKSAVKRNGWGHMALLCDPSSIAFGFFNEIESKSTYEHDKLSYLTSLQCAFDTAIIWEEDVLAFEITDVNVATVAVTVVDSSKAAVSGATVTLKADDGTTVTGTTGANGVATISSVSFGSYEMTVKATNYKDKVETVAVNNEAETLAVKLAKA